MLSTLRMDCQMKAVRAHHPNQHISPTPLRRTRRVSAAVHAVWEWRTDGGRVEGVALVVSREWTSRACGRHRPAEAG